MLRRPRRNRRSSVIRDMVRENSVSVHDLIYPLFLLEGKNKKIEINSMPGVFRYSEDLLLKEIGECMSLGIKAFVLFPVVEDSYKDKNASKCIDPDFFYLKSLAKVKSEFPEALIMTDVALDPYSSDGHDGLVDENGVILNDETVELLGKMSVLQAEAGVDIIGPSDMMDGRIEFIRDRLDDRGYEDVSIMSYTAKYASAFYGPFRDALDSAPKAGDKKTYQMDPANTHEAIVEAELDYLEGADILMVKPALSYLDVIQSLSQQFDIPIAAYNVSGEYSMVKAAAQKGWLDGDSIAEEILLSMKRAGANIILTYFAKEFASRKQ